jgi:hypothetical protein
MKKIKYIKGQALVALLFFVLMGMTISVAATFIIASNSLSVTKIGQGITARQLADTGAENALIKLLRDDTYGGETFKIGEDTIMVSVSGEGNKIIESQGMSGDFTRKVEVNVSYTNNILRVVSWKEIF